MSVCFTLYDKKCPHSTEFTLVYQLDPTILPQSRFINYNLKPIEASQVRLKNLEHQPGAKLSFPVVPYLQRVGG